MKGQRELLVGTVIIAGILVAVVGTLWLQGTTWGRPVTVVEVWVRDVGLLMRGNPTVYRGVPIGRVSSVTVDTTGAFVRVRADLEGEVLIPEDARAVISPQSLFGDWQLEIVTRARFPTFEYYEVPPGYVEDDVRIIGGYALPDISRLTAAADEISENISALTERFDRAFTEETADALNQIIRNAQDISEGINDLIQQQAATFERVSAQVELAATEIGEAAAVARGTLQRVDGLIARGEIDTILVNVQTMTRTVDELALRFGETAEGVGPVIARADTAFAVMTRLVERVEEGEGALGRLLVDPTLALRAENAVFQLEALLEDIRRNPGRYVRLSIF